MLAKAERELMDAVLLLCGEKGSCLASPSELANHMKEGGQAVEPLLSALKSDGYLDYIPSKRKGETVYVVTLMSKGRCYPREKRRERQQIALRLAVAAAGAILSFLAGVILRLVFR